MNDSYSKVHLEAIDGLRGIAILMVVYQHTLATAIGNVVTGSFGFKFPQGHISRLAITTRILSKIFWLRELTIFSSV